MELEKEDPIKAAIAAIVDSGELAGAATMIWRDGKIVQHACIGWRDVEARLPIQRDNLFRVASMTKPITCAAALMLFDEGRFALDDPISRFAPEFSKMRVLRSPNGSLDETDPAGRQITFEDLLTHRSGFTYGAFHSGPIAKAYDEALGSVIDSHLAPDDWIARLSDLPLIDQPGAGFHYGHSTDLLGLLIARIEDAPLGEVLNRRIFGPLGMKDTAFVVPSEKRSRCAGAYGFDETGSMARLLTGPGGSFLSERTQETKFESGGQGLWSTLDDCLTFARMFLGKGEVDGVRLLTPDTLELMTLNWLTDADRAGAQMAGMPLPGGGHRYGLGVAVVTEPARAATMPCGGGLGAVGWPGAFGGWWRADPNDNSILIFLSHCIFDLEQLSNGIGLGSLLAISEFQNLAQGGDYQ